MKSQTKTILFFTTILLISGLFVHAYFYQSGLVYAQNEEIAEEGGEDILNLASNLEKVEIKLEVFSSPDFMSLKDFSVALEPEPQGRSNPFALVGFDGQAVNNSSTKIGR